MKQDAGAIVLRKIGICRKLSTCQLDVYCSDLPGNSRHFTYEQEPVLLLFPEKESTFKVSEVLKALDHPLVHTVQYKAAHELIASFSSNGNQEAAERAFRWETYDAL